MSRRHLLVKILTSLTCILFHHVCAQHKTSKQHIIMTNWISLINNANTQELCIMTIYASNIWHNENLMYFHDKNCIQWLSSINVCPNLNGSVPWVNLTLWNKSSHLTCFWLDSGLCELWPEATNKTYSTNENILTISNTNSHFIT